MKSVNISEFRSNLLKYLKNAQRGEQINVTSKGISLAILTSPASQHDTAKAKLRKLAKTAIIQDVISPIDDDWDACKANSQ